MLKGKLKRQLALFVVLGMLFSCMNLSVHAQDGGIFSAGDVVQIAAGSYHSLILKNNGTVYAWGVNESMQLGNNDDSGLNRNMPVMVNFPGLSEGEKIISISAGTSHSMALTSLWHVYAWGDNTYGQIGDGTLEGYSASPILVNFQNLEEGEKVTSISAGSNHCMAVTDLGNVYTWGYNVSGQLGNNSVDMSNVPVKIEFLDLSTTENEKILSVSAGTSNSMAVTSLGNIYTWGSNTYGQIGDGTTSPSLIPKKLTITNENIKSVSAGTFYCMALTEDGDVYAWGRNNYGQLGDDIVANKTTPTKITIPVAIKSIVAGYNNSLAVSTNGVIYVWGRNDLGQLGDGTNIMVTTPKPISTGETMVSVAIGRNHGMAVGSTGNFYIWGDNTYGQLGDGAIGQRIIPCEINISGLLYGEKIEYVASGEDHNIALSNLGRVYAWGDNTYGQLGDGTNISKGSPVLIGALNLPNNEKVVSIAAGFDQSVAITNLGNVYAWGYNGYYQLGDGTTANKNSPVLINFPLTEGEKIKSVKFGIVSGVAVSDAGNVFTWGSNYYMQLGNNSNRYEYGTTPAQLIIAGEVVESVSAERFDNVALCQSGHVYIWGTGYQNIPTPTLLSFPSLPVDETIVSIVSGDNYNMAVTDEKNVYAWGGNYIGQLGDGTTDNSDIPKEITISDESIETIAAGLLHGMAVTVDGELYTWGNNDCGQLGDGTIINKTSPISVSLTGVVVSVSAGSSHSIAVTDAGKVYVWGDNTYGQIGDGLRVYQTSTPFKIKTPKSLTLNLQTDSTFDYALTASNIRNPYRFIYYISYDPSKYVVDDLCKTTSTKEVTTGKIEGTNVYVLEHDTTIGLITMTFTDNSASFTGILNNIVFKAISSGEGKISAVTYAAQ